MKRTQKNVAKTNRVGTWSRNGIATVEAPDKKIKHLTIEEMPPTLDQIADEMEECLKANKPTKAPKAPKNLAIIKAAAEEYQKATKGRSLYTGSPVPATKVYRRTMPEFKNCTATCWMLVNEDAGSYTFANSYQGEVPNASWNPAHYTYPLTPKNQKKVAKKAELMTELEPMEWPTWVVSAKVAKVERKARTRKVAAK